MGVFGLWQLLESVGHPVKLDGLEGKRLGVDANVWLYKFIRGFREKDNATNIDGHKLGLYHRISKLLFYKIKPVFVFDGPAPVLKRRTLERRRDVRNKHLEKQQVLAKRLLAQQLKEQYPNAKINEDSIVIPGLISNHLAAAEKLTDEDRDLFYLPPGATKLDQRETDSDSDRYSDIEYIKEDLKSQSESQSQNKPNDKQTIVYHVDTDDSDAELANLDSSVDIESEEFRKLPAEVRYEILMDIKESRRRLRRAGNLPDDAGAFSNLQLERLKSRRLVQEKIEQCERDICSLYTGETDSKQTVRAFRVQSDSTRTMLYYTNKPKEVKTDGLEAIDESSSKGSPRMKSPLDETCDNPVDPRESNNTPHEASNVASDTDSDVEFIEHDQKSQSQSQSQLQSHSPSLSLSLSPAHSQSQLASDNEQKTVLISSDSEDDDAEFVPVTLESTVNIESDDSEQLTSEIDIEHSIDANKSMASPCEASNLSNHKDEPSCSNRLTESFVPQIMSQEKIEEREKEADVLPNPQVEPEITESSPVGTIEEPTDELEQKELDPTNNPEEVEIDDDDDSSFDRSKLHEPSMSSALGEVRLAASVGAGIEAKQCKFKQIEFDLPLNAIDGEASISSHPLLEGIEPQSSTVVQDSQVEQAELEKDKPAPCQPSSSLQSARSELNKAERVANKVTTKMMDEAKELLELFGIPWIESPGEAEAQCAQLERLGLTDGTITDDSDIWLFGAQNVYRYFFSHDKYVMQYKSIDIEHHLRMSRENLICFAMLVGSDYTDGIANVGPVTAIEILSEFPGERLQPLQKFKTWRLKYELDKSDKHKRSRVPSSKRREAFLKFKLPDEFPSQVVFDGYIRPIADLSDEKFSWSMPDLDGLREYARRQFGWDPKRIDRELLPLMKRLNDKTQKTIDSFFFKTAANQNPELFRSKRLNKALSKIQSSSQSSSKAGQDDDEHNDDNDSEIQLSEDDEKERKKSRTPKKRPRGRARAAPVGRKRTKAVAR